MAKPNSSGLAKWKLSISVCTTCLHLFASHNMECAVHVGHVSNRFHEVTLSKSSPALPPPAIWSSWLIIQDWWKGFHIKAPRLQRWPPHGLSLFPTALPQYCTCGNYLHVAVQDSWLDGNRTWRGEAAVDCCNGNTIRQSGQSWFKTASSEHAYVPQLLDRVAKSRRGSQYW